MPIRFIDQPHPVQRERYEELIHRMVARSASWPGVESVYQIGGISSPGISDIDLVVVFQDGASFADDPRRQLQVEDRYLLSHGLYGVHRSNFLAAQRFTFFHNYRHLQGVFQPMPSSDAASESVAVIKHQVAIEYLLRMYMSLAVQITYRTIKVRSLLLTAKAIGYDLDFLSITCGPLRDLLDRLTGWRNTWFVRRPSREEMTTWTLLFFQEIEKLLRELVEDIGFYHLPAERYSMARHLRVVNRRPLSYIHSGVVMPSWMGTLCSKRWFSIHDRLNVFQFAVPVRSVRDHGVLEHKLACEDRLAMAGQRHLPHFLLLKSPVHLRVIC